MNGTPPVFKKRLGTLELAIFEHNGDNGIRHSVSIQRSWKSKEGEWKDTKMSLNKKDILTLATLLQTSYIEFFGKVK